MYVREALGQMVIGPGAPGGTVSPLSSEAFMRNAGKMSSLELMTYSQIHPMPGHATNIIARLMQSGCCPGARGSGGGMSTASVIHCADGQSYRMENWQGGIRARANMPTKPECDLIEEGGILTLRGLSGAARAAWLDRNCR